MTSTIERTAIPPATTVSPSTEPPRPTLQGWATRAGVVGAIAVVAVWYVFTNEPFRSGGLASAVVLAIGALSLNVLVGYTGQISLGHQAFIGIGGFTSAYVMSQSHQSFYVALIAAAIVGALQAVVLGLVALRVRGLYFAVVTLAWGFVAEESIFRLRSFTGGGAGAFASRPTGFTADRSYLLLCVAVLALVLLLDWRLVSTKAGRALQALRESPQVASSFGVNVRAYTLFAFAIAGLYAGIAGALFASRLHNVVAASFSFQLIALPYLLVTVVGGLRRRGGIVLFAVLYELGAEYLPDFAKSVNVAFLANNAPYIIPTLSGVLAVITLIFQPDGLGTFTAPVGRWLKGGRFDLHGGGVSAGAEGVSVRP